MPFHCEIIIQTAYLKSYYLIRLYCVVVKCIGAHLYYSVYMHPTMLISFVHSYIYDMQLAIVKHVAGYTPQLQLATYCMVYNFVIIKFYGWPLNHLDGKFMDFKLTEAQFYTQCHGNIQQISTQFTDLNFKVLPLTIKP